MYHTYKDGAFYRRDLFEKRKATQLGGFSQKHKMFNEPAKQFLLGL